MCHVLCSVYIVCVCVSVFALCSALRIMPCFMYYVFGVTGDVSCIVCYAFCAVCYAFCAMHYALCIVYYVLCVRYMYGISLPWLSHTFLVAAQLLLQPSTCGQGSRQRPNAGLRGVDHARGSFRGPRDDD